MTLEELHRNVVELYFKYNMDLLSISRHAGTTLAQTDLIIKQEGINIREAHNAELRMDFEHRAHLKPIKLPEKEQPIIPNSVRYSSNPTHRNLIQNLIEKGHLRP